MTTVETTRATPAGRHIERLAAGWLADFAAAVGGARTGELDRLFLPDAWWRDLLSLSWDFRTFHGQPAIHAAVTEYGRNAAYRAAAPAAGKPVRLVRHEFDGEFIETFFDFETRLGRGRGVLRLRRDANQRWRAWTLLTTLQELRGHEPAVGARRPVKLATDALSGENWAGFRRRVQQFEDAEPEVLIVGGGHGGLTVAAHLEVSRVRTLVVERNARIGDNWRNRYPSLTLHDPIWADHLPYLRFPESWPVHTPKDKLADWLECYVAALDLNVWTAATLTDSSYDDAARRWTVSIQRSDGSTRTLHPAHIVLATGVHGEAKMPAMPGLESFRGRIMHSSQYAGIEPGWSGRAVVVGAGNSAHDIAEDLCRSGAAVTLVQRSSTYVMSQRHGIPTLYGSLFHEGGPPVEDADLMGASFPYLLALQRSVKQTRIIAELDAEMLAGLRNAGFHVDFGAGGAGGLSKILNGPGGYYIDVGCSQLIADGEIAIAHGSVERVTERGVVLDNGSTCDADLLVFATGYQNMRETARRIFGDEVADRCHPVWGLNSEGEIKGMWRNSGHPGFWFMGGPLYIARFYSRYLALQILGIQRGAATHPAVAADSSSP